MPENDLSELELPQVESKLKKIFSERKKLNPEYSYRNFASDLNLNFSTLHKVITGQRKLGFQIARELGENLGFSVRRPDTRRRKSTRDGLYSLNAFSEIQVHWLSLAVLESLKLDDFEPNAEWVAKRFELPLATIEELLQRMEVEGILKRTKKEWKDSLKDSAAFGETTASGAVVRRVIKDLMLVSAKTVDKVATEKRKHSFAIFPVASAQVPALRKKIVSFQRDLGRMAERSKRSKDEIYAFQLGFFPLTKGL